MTAAYDRINGIHEYLGDLDGLRQLADERRAAGYDRHEDLREYLVLGRWWFDSCGNCMRCEIKTRAGNPFADLADALPAVVSLDEFRRLLGKAYSLSGTGASIPTSHDECTVCGARFTIAEAYDAVSHHSDGPTSYQHKRCAPRNATQVLSSTIWLIASHAAVNLARLPIPADAWSRIGSR